MRWSLMERVLKIRIWIWIMGILALLAAGIWKI